MAKMNIRDGIIAILLGVFVAVFFSIYWAVESAELSSLRSDGTVTTAVVSEIRTFERVLVRSGSPQVFVTYSVDGVTYTNRLRVGSSGVNVGDEFVIVYNPNAPDRMTFLDESLAEQGDGTAFHYLLYIVCVLVILYGIWILQKGIRAKRKETSKE